MDWNLINLFDFYLTVVFLLGTGLRIQQYRTLLRVVRAVPSRWPCLFALIKQHRAIFLTWATFAPALVVLVLYAVQLFASRFVWPDAGKEPYGLTVGRLLEHPWAVPLVVIFGAAMVLMDVYSMYAVAEVNRPQMEAYFDQAEHWLTTWKAPVVRIFTFGYINPRRMVHEGVRSALLSASRMLNSTLWWVSVQTALRIAFGLSLWLTYAWSRHGWSLVG